MTKINITNSTIFVNDVADDMVIDVDDMIADMAMMWKYW